LNRSRRLLAAAVTVAAVLGALTLASAAGLPLNGGTLSSAAVGHPCPGTATAVPATPWSNHARYRAVTLTLPPGCGARNVQVTVTSGPDVRSGSGDTNASGQVTISFGTTNDNLHTYAVTSGLTFKATVSGWDLPTTATMPAIWCTVITTGSTETCAATVTLGVRGGNNFYQVVVTTPSTSWVTWEVTFNLAHPFYGTVPTRLGNADLDPYSAGGGDVNWAYNTANVNDVQRSSPCSVLPGELRVTGLNSGTSPNVFRDVKNNRTRSFDLLLNVTQAGYFDVIEPNCV